MSKMSSLVQEDCSVFTLMSVLIIMSSRRAPSNERWSRVRQPKVVLLGHAGHVLRSYLGIAFTILAQLGYN